MSSLTLSGGGFRATLFHLGTISYLRRTGKLAEVKRIYSVSGGSILAAHLVLNWHKYNNDNPALFEDAARKIIDFTRADLRGEVVGRWILCWLLVLLLWSAPPSLGWFFFASSWTLIVGYVLWLAAGFGLILWFRKTWSLTKWLERAYGRLFGYASLHNLADKGGPELHLLTTDLTVGDLAAFSSDGFRYVSYESDGTRIVHFRANKNLPVGLGVAASSGYPVLFPPVRIDNDTLGVPKGDFPYARYLTDGGVYENLGVRAWRLLQSGAGLPDDLIVSDAQREIDTAVGESFHWLYKRGGRSSDIMMKRVNELENDRLPTLPDCQVVRLHDQVTVQPAPAREVQWRVQNVRTDLNSFSPAEIQLLVYQGFAAAFQACVYGPRLTIYGIQLVGDMPFPIPPNPIPPAGLPPDGVWLPYLATDRSVNPNAAAAVKKSARLRFMDLPPAPLWYVNAALAILCLSLLYPSLLGAVWLGSLLFPGHVRPNPPWDVAYPSKKLYEDMGLPLFLETLTNAYEDPAENTEPNKVVHHAVFLTAGPFNTSGSQPIADFHWQATLRDGWIVNQKLAFVVSNSKDSKQQKRYIAIDPADVVFIRPNKLSVHVPPGEGDASLWILLSVSRADKAPLPFPPKDFILTPEVKP